MIKFLTNVMLYLCVHVVFPAVIDKLLTSRVCRLPSSLFYYEKKPVVSSTRGDSMYVPLSFRRSLTSTEIEMLQWPIVSSFPVDATGNLRNFPASTHDLRVLTHQQHLHALGRRLLTMASVIVLSFASFIGIAMYGQSICVGADCMHQKRKGCASLDSYNTSSKHKGANCGVTADSALQISSCSTNCRERFGQTVYETLMFYRDVLSRYSDVTGSGSFPHKS
eukprot:gene24294-29370_t